MAKFRNGDLVLTSSQEIIQGGVSVINATRDGKFNSLALSGDAYAVAIDEFSIDGTLIGNSDTALPTEQAVKTYVDNKISGSIAASVDNRMSRYDGTDGIQGTGISVDDSNNMTGIAGITGSGLFTSGSGDDFVQLNPAGSIEICDSGALAQIDFKSGSAEDADCRIQQNTNGFRFYTGGNGAIVNALTINSAQNIIVTNNLTIQGTNKSAGYLYAGITDPTNTTRLNYDGYLYATKVYNAVWG